MTDLKQPLLSDVIRLLKENCDKSTSWTVKAEQVKPIKPKSTSTPQSLSSAPPPTIPQEKKKIEIVALPIATPPVKKEKEPESKGQHVEKKQEQLLPFEDLSQKLLKSFPQFSVKKDTLSDKVPYLNTLEAECIVFSFKENKESDLFLNNLQKALENHHASSCFFNAASGIPPEELDMFFEQAQAKLIIASSVILKNPLFLPFLKEIPASSEWFLGKSRLFILEPFSSYFTNPQKKKALWQTLCAILKSRSTQASS